jgi:DNA-binding PadR family transcriptional regulator
MYPDVFLPKPLSAQTLYVLLVLSSSSLHIYALKSAILNASLGSVNLSDGRIYTLVRKLHHEGLIELADTAPAGKSGMARIHYTISDHGLICLKEELTRLNHVIKIANHAHLLEHTTPLDIQKLIVRHGTIKP